MLPQAFDDYFKKPAHTHKTRYVSTNNYEKVSIVTAVEKQLLKYIGPNVWNNTRNWGTGPNLWKSIPSVIKNSMSLKVFIKSYRTHLIGNYTNDDDIYIYY